MVSTSVTALVPQSLALITGNPGMLPTRAAGPWDLAKVYPFVLLEAVNSYLSLQQRCCQSMLLFLPSVAEPDARLTE